MFPLGGSKPPKVVLGVVITRHVNKTISSADASLCQKRRAKPALLEMSLDSTQAGSVQFVWFKPDGTDGSISGAGAVEDFRENFLTWVTFEFEKLPNLNTNVGSHI